MAVVERPVAKATVAVTELTAQIRRLRYVVIGTAVLVALTFILTVIVAT